MEERQAAYKTAQERLVALNPGIWYVKAAPSVTLSKDLHGVTMYTLGSPLPEELWVTN